MTEFGAICFLYTETSERAWLTDSEKLATKFAKHFGGNYRLSQTGFWIITIR